MQISLLSDCQTGEVIEFTLGYFSSCVNIPDWMYCTEGCFVRSILILETALAQGCSPNSTVATDFEKYSSICQNREFFRFVNTQDINFYFLSVVLNTSQDFLQLFQGHE